MLREILITIAVSFARTQTTPDFVSEKLIVKLNQTCDLPTAQYGLNLQPVS
jgi:hypothetical protein